MGIILKKLAAYAYNMVTIKKQFGHTKDIFYLSLNSYSIIF